MKCSKCTSENSVKNGFAKGRQRFRCKNCGNNYSVEQKSTAKLPSVRRMGLMMYLEGIGFNSIGRLLGVSHVAVIKWIKKYGSQLNEVKNESPVEVVEVDEMHSYIMSKKTTVGYGLQLIERENDTLISLLGTEVPKQEKGYGKRFKI
jgi:transposase-like protein